MRRTLPILSLFTSAMLAGCHSHYIQATVTNQTAAEVNVVQVEYPGAAFGTQSIPAGGSFHYRFKLLGTGDLKITWTDAAKQDHTVKGPHLNEGQEGSLTINFPTQSQAVVSASLRP